MAPERLTGPASIAALARARAAVLARSISVHHQECKACQRGGNLGYGPRGVRRFRCRDEAALFSELAFCQREGWK